MTTTDFQLSSEPIAPLPPRRSPSPKQAAILHYLQHHPLITLTTATTLIGGNLYTNAKHHVGTTLANMVKRGMLSRSKPGTFTLPPSP